MKLLSLENQFLRVMDIGAEKADRLNNTARWQSANAYNLGQQFGYSEYKTISPAVSCSK